MILFTLVALIASSWLLLDASSGGMKKESQHELENLRRPASTCDPRTHVPFSRWQYTNASTTHKAQKKESSLLQSKDMTSLIKEAAQYLDSITGVNGTLGVSFLCCFGCVACVARADVVLASLLPSSIISTLQLL